MQCFRDYLSEANQVLATAREESHGTRAAFLNTELSLCKTFAENALAAQAAGNLSNARESALHAKKAYRSVKKFLPKRLLQGEERQLIAGELLHLTPLIEQLSTIK